MGEKRNQLWWVSASLTKPLQVVVYFVRQRKPKPEGV
jgi:hypothetical protein